MQEFIPPETPIQDFAIFADESAITTGRHMHVGATVVRKLYVRALYQSIHDFRTEHKMHAELKWSKVSNQKLPAYKALVDIFFDFMDRGALTFRVTTFDNHKWDHKRYNNSDPDIGISKLFYQMLLHQVIGVYGDLASLYICLDRRRSSTGLLDLQRMLNAGAGKDYGLTFSPVRVLTAKDSKKDDLLQINDVILGGVSALKNKKHLKPNARAAKTDLAQHILKRSGLATYDRDSLPEQSRFAIWNRKPL